MTSKSPTETVASSVFDERVSYSSGQWIPHRQLQIPVEDDGFRQGVTAVERLRTYSGRVFAIDAHVQRWQHSVSELGIHGLPSTATTRTLLHELLDRNTTVLEAERDVGITMFATPGVAGRNRPTHALHLNRLDHQSIDHHIQHGQPLVVTDVRQPDPSCWPRTIKTRSRIHYHLADRVARQRDPDALGLLLDNDGSITETSVANIAIVQSGEIISPPSDRVLGGITQTVIEKLAHELDLSWIKQPVTVDALTKADEVLLMGTTGGIWFVSAVNDTPIGDGHGGDVYRALRQRLDDFAHGPQIH